MAAISHPLDGAFERLDRAQKHFAELCGHVATFRQEYLDACRIYVEPNPPYEIHPFPPQTIDHPPIVSVLLGEIVYNLRSALDYLAFELARHDSGQIQENTQFPIDDTPEKFARSITTRLRGVSSAHVLLIEKLQPYTGCNWTEVLRDISNPDKHRQLTARGSSFSVTVLKEGAMLPGGGNCYTVREVQRPDGTKVQVELVGAIEIIVPVGTHPTLGAFGDTVEIVTASLIPKVQDLLETFKPKL
jgi:hypothetical protein